MNADTEEQSRAEQALVERAKTDKDAFGELYQRYYDRIYNYIYYRTGNSHEAEDLAARVFMRAMKHIGAYTDQGVPFSAWLYRIARNMVANWYRDNSRRQIISLDDITQWHMGDEGAELAVQMREDKANLLAAIQRLPSDRQELLTLKFVDQLPNIEIGDIMGRSEGAIKSLYHRTLAALREDLQPTDEHDTPRDRVSAWFSGWLHREE